VSTLDVSRDLEGTRWHIYWEGFGCERQTDVYLDPESGFVSMRQRVEGGWEEVTFSRAEWTALVDVLVSIQNAKPAAKERP